MPRITLIKLLRYREWTEELGFDREWIIQDKQASLYLLLQGLFSKKGGFVIPMRYDYFLVLSNGIDEKTHQNILTDLEPETPYGLKMVSLVHEYPFTAQLIATRIIEDTDKKLVYLEGREDEIVVAHIDFNDITKYTGKTSVMESYAKIMAVFTNITNFASRLGGITTYLGGDNMLAIVPRDTLEKFLENIPSYLKVGIGISKSPRKALLNAAKALTKIRKERDRQYIIVSDE